MKSFSQWQGELREDATDTMDYPSSPSYVRTGLTPPNQAAVPPQPSNPAQQPEFGVGGFSNFKGWYDSSRGRWSDVEQAAAKDPTLKKFIDTAAQAFDQAYRSRQDPGQASFQWQGSRGPLNVKGFGQVGNVVEKLTKKMIPGHSFRDAQKSYQARLGEKLNGMRGAQNDFRDAGPNAATAVLGQQSQSRADDAHTLDFKSYVLDLERRLRDVESKIGIQPGQSQFSLQKQASGMR